MSAGLEQGKKCGYLLTPIILEQMKHNGKQGKTNVSWAGTG